MTRLGYTVVAECDSEYKLTGNASECRVSEEALQYPGSNFTTFGTWDAFNEAYNAQESSELDFDEDFMDSELEQ